jgi:hypothetical protein
MAIINDFRDMLQQEWTPDPAEYNREEPVPEPTILIESQTDPRSFDLAQGDVIFVKDGGIPTIEPAGIAYSEERIEVLIDADIRTARGRGRLTGDNPDFGEFDGLAGEVQRITRRFRHGLSDFDIMYQVSFDDQTGSYPAGVWAGTWSLRLVKFASVIKEDSVGGPS